MNCKLNTILIRWRLTIIILSVIFVLIIKPTRCTNFSNLFFGIKLYMFWTIPLSIIRNFSLYTQQSYMSYRFGDSCKWHPACSCHQTCMYLLSVQWKTPDHAQRNCLKRGEFYSINNFEKLLHLVGFIIRIYHDSRSPECQSCYFCVYKTETKCWIKCKSAILYSTQFFFLMPIYNWDSILCSRF